MSRKEYLAFLERRSKTAFGQIWQAYRQVMLRLAGEYLSSTRREAREIRRVVGELSEVRHNLLTLADEQSWFIRAKYDATRLRKTLAMISMADFGYDLSTQQCVTSLHDQAKFVAKIDVKPMLREIAILSSNVRDERKEAQSTKEFFRSFSPWIWPS